MIGTCTVCDKQFEYELIGSGRPRLYCCKKCYERARTMRRTAKRVHKELKQVPCRGCGETFQQLCATQVFCCPACSKKYHNARRKPQERRPDAKVGRPKKENVFVKREPKPGVALMQPGFGKEEKKLQHRIDVLCHAACLPEYDEHHPEKSIALLEPA